jgi:hypothetical protein
MSYREEGVRYLLYRRGSSARRKIGSKGGYEKPEDVYARLQRERPGSYEIEEIAFKRTVFSPKEFVKRRLKKAK